MSVIDLDWNYCTNFHDIERDYYQDFLHKITNTHQTLTGVIEEGFKVQRFVFNGTIDPNNDDELRILTEKNKQLKDDIDTKLEELKRQQLKYESFKKDQKLLSQEVKETHEAFLMAKKYYKKFLKLYYSIEQRNKEKQTIYIQFFTEAKKDSENYSVRLLRDTKSGSYELLHTTPKLNLHKELQRKLQETNDVPGVLCSIRQAFMVLKANKK